MAVQRLSCRVVFSVLCFFAVSKCLSSFCSDSAVGDTDFMKGPDVNGWVCDVFFDWFSQLIVLAAELERQGIDVTRSETDD